MKTKVFLSATLVLFGILIAVLGFQSDELGRQTP
jgi:hypothetical protein